MHGTAPESTTTLIPLKSSFFETKKYYLLHETLQRKYSLVLLHTIYFG